ncbi:MAG: hypothetical protein KAR62_02605 [Sphingomonadales bacterium]|nr:hypothetical protein [Sphingomonadales bacterium]
MKASDITIIATGVMVSRALKAAEEMADKGIEARVVNLSTIKPLDGAEILAAAKDTGLIVTAEDHNIMGGMGSAVAEFVVENCPVPMKFVGVNDTFGKSGEHTDLPDHMGIGVNDIVKACNGLLSNKESSDAS